MKLKFIDPILNIGLKHVVGVREEHRVRFINRMLFFGFCSSIFFIIVNSYYGLERPTYLAISSLPILGFSYYLNSLGYNRLSAWFSLFFMSALIMAISYDIKSDLGFHYLLFAILGLPGFTLPVQKRKSILTLMGAVLAMIATIIFFDFDQKGMTVIPVENIQSIRLLVFLQASALYIFKVLSNLTEMNNRYNAYLENNSKLENQTRMSDLGRLTAGIAHEINNPLTVIRGSSSYCLKRLRNNQLDNQRLKSELTKVTKHVDRVVKIVEGLRFVSRDATNDTFEPHDVNEAIKDAYELCRYKLTSEGVTSNFVPLYTQATCNIRIVQIEQVVFTLISNAIDAFGEQEEKNISIVVSEGNKDVFIRVRDNGPGIPAKIKREVLKPFFTTKPVGKGTGLGLSIASEIIQKHNGHLIVEDSLEGASFLIRLPKVIKKNDQESKAA